MHPLTRTSMIAAFLAALMVPAATAEALAVGRINLSVDGVNTLVKVATTGKAEVKVSGEGASVTAFVPEGERELKPLDLSTGKSMVKGITFKKEDGGLKINLQLRQEAVATLESNGPEGFMVALAPSGSRPAKAAETAAATDLGPKVAGYTYRIVDLSLEGDSQKSELVISADGPASYRHSVRENAKVLRLTFANSALAWAGDSSRLRDEAIESVKVSQVNSGGDALVQVDVRLRQKSDYSFQRDQNQLVVRLTKPMADKAAPKKGDLETSVSLDVQNADLVGVLKVLAEQAGFEYQFTKEILAKTGTDAMVTLKVENRPFKEVMESILGGVSAKMLRQGNTLYIGGDLDVATKLGRLPTITRTYTPKVLSITQLLETVRLHYNFDDPAKDRFTKGAQKDPREGSRVMLTGTEDEVAEWRSLFARYDVPEAGDGSSSSVFQGEQTEVIRMQYVDQSLLSLINEGIRQLYPLGETAPTAIFDSGTRALIVTANGRYMAKIKKLLSKLDVKPEQVNIEAKIIEVNQGETSQFGINWQSNSTSTNPNVQGAFDSTIAGDFTSQLSYATVQNGLNVLARVQAMVSANQADLISSPNITTNDNQEAEISTTDVQVSVATTTTISNGLVTVAQQFTENNIPLTLKVTPKISRKDRRVLMVVSFELASPSGAAPAPGAPVPKSEQKAKTNVSVFSGETAVIGGLVRQVNIVNDRKVPVLGDIPLLGLLFKFRSEEKTKKEVMIFIMPTIVED